MKSQESSNDLAHLTAACCKRCGENWNPAACSALVVGVMVQKLSVLIVEDDRRVAEAIRDSVKVAGYEVCGIAGTIQQAVSLTRLTRPDLAIIDVDLGEGPDGIELARRLTKITALAIMFLTGDSNRLKEIDVGHAWMGKPYRALDLINALDVVYSIAEGEPVKGRMPPELHLIRPQA